MVVTGTMHAGYLSRLGEYAATEPGTHTRRLVSAKSDSGSSLNALLLSSIYFHMDIEAVTS